MAYADIRRECGLVLFACNRERSGAVVVVGGREVEVDVAV